MCDRRGGGESLGAQVVSSNAKPGAVRRNNGGFFEAWTRKHGGFEKSFRRQRRHAVMQQTPEIIELISMNRAVLILASNPLTDPIILKFHAVGNVVHPDLLSTLPDFPVLLRWRHVHSFSFIAQTDYAVFFFNTKHAKQRNLRNHEAHVFRIFRTFVGSYSIFTTKVTKNHEGIIHKSKKAAHNNARL